MKTPVRATLLIILILCICPGTSLAGEPEKAAEKAGGDQAGLAPADPENPEQEEPGWRDYLAALHRRIRQTLEAPGLDVYFPIYTWHNTYMYDDTSKYNEIPGGFGLGHSFIDEDGDEHALFLVGFIDSNDKFEPYGGYAFLKSRTLDHAGNWRVGAGISLGLTARYEYHYLPIPLPVPIFSLSYRNVALQATYLPWTYNGGNVLFSWLRLSF
ncbi:MAG: lipid IV(A) palmitoyltransferase PagP [Desulfovibrionaceae bacterium]|nr:lipid IV(A) palmitoyltransferase PagP [Desulfovibrionaceae bacterium]